VVLDLRVEEEAELDEEKVHVDGHQQGQQHQGGRPEDLRNKKSV
jgi:hypothetical protein